MSSNTPKKISFSQKTAVLCVGNELRGDDAFGPLLFSALEALRADNFLPLDGGEVPESLSGAIKAFGPEVLIIADASHFGGAPYEVRLMKAAECKNASFSTHGLPLSMLVKFLEHDIAGLKTFFLLMQVRDTSFASVPSDELVGAVQEALELLNKTR